MAEILGILTGSAVFIIILILGFFWNLLVAYMAAKRGRSSLGWFVLSLCIRPLIAMIILLCIGDR